MQSVVVIDDRLLLAVLAGVAPSDLTQAAESGEVFTTGSWYYRLGRAVSDPSTHGTLTKALSALTRGTPSARVQRHRQAA